MAVRRLLCALALAPSVTVSFMPRHSHALPFPVRTRPQPLGSAGHGGVATLLGRDEVDWVPCNVVGGSDAPLKRSRNPWEAYQHALETKPLVTKMWTSFVIGGLGDILSQLVGGAGSLAKIDRTRLLIFASMGGVYIGSVIHMWYGFLDRLIKKPEVKRRLPKRGGTVALQLLLDQTFGAAVVNSGFLITLWLMQAAVAGNLFPLSITYRAVRKNLEREFWPMLKANWKLWPFANLVNFALVPIQFRVLFANVVSVFWNMYMSASANR